MLAEADQVGAACLDQGLVDQTVVFWIFILDQRPLHGLFMGIGGHIDLFHGPRVQAGIVHDRGYRRGRGVKILHLLGHIAQVPQVLGQLYGLLEGGARMGGHQIGHHILLEPQLLVEPLILLEEPRIDLMPGLAHLVQHRVGHMLRSHLQLAGDVVLDQLLEKGIAGIGQQIVEADAAADKDLLDAGQLPELPQQAQIVAVVGPQILTGRREEALPVLADALAELLGTGGLAEVGRGAAHVVDIALEVRLPGHLPGRG